MTFLVHFSNGEGGAGGRDASGCGSGDEDPFEVGSGVKDAHKVAVVMCECRRSGDNKASSMTMTATTG